MASSALIEKNSEAPPLDYDDADQAPKPVLSALSRSLRKLSMSITSLGSRRYARERTVGGRVFFFFSRGKEFLFLDDRMLFFFLLALSLDNQFFSLSLICFPSLSPPTPFAPSISLSTSTSTFLSHLFSFSLSLLLSLALPNPT